MDEFFQVFKQKYGRNRESVHDCEYIDFLESVLEFMRIEKIKSVADRPDFFRDLYDNCGLSVVLSKARLSQVQSRKFALLHVYVIERQRENRLKVFGACLTGTSERAATMHTPYPVTHISSHLQDEDSRFLLECLTVTDRYAWQKLPAYLALQSILIGSCIWIRQTRFRGKERDLSKWTRNDWSEFDLCFPKFDRRFDCGKFFYAVLAERSRAGAFARQKFADLHIEYFATHEAIVDAKRRYAKVWQTIRGQTNLWHHVVDVAYQQYDSQSGLALLQGGGGLISTMMHLCEHLLLREKILHLMRRRVVYLLPTLQHGTTFDNVNVIHAVNHVFVMGGAILKWCDYIDASCGRIGEGAVRLCSALYAGKRFLPAAYKDPSFLFGLDGLCRSNTAPCLYFASVTTQRPREPYLVLGEKEFKAFAHFGPCTIADYRNALPHDQPTAAMSVLMAYLSRESYTNNVSRYLYEKFGRVYAKRDGGAHYGVQLCNLSAMVAELVGLDEAVVAQKAAEQFDANVAAMRDLSLIGPLEPRWAYEPSLLQDGLRGGGDDDDTDVGAFDTSQRYLKKFKHLE